MVKTHSLTKIAKGKADWGKTVTIKGKKYDEAMIKAAKYAVKGEKGGKALISVADATLIFKALAPSGNKGNSTYDKIEKATSAYIRKNFKFTDAAKKKFDSLIRKRGAAQANRTKAKRPVAAAAAAPSAKKGRLTAAEAELRAKCNAVSSGIMLHKDLPQSALTMLCGGVPHVLTVMKEDRHDMQNKFVEMIAEVLTGVETQFDKQIESNKEQVDGADANKAMIVHEEGEASKELEKLKAATGAADEAASADAKAVKDAEVALADCKAAQAAGDAQIKKVEAAKAKVDSVVSSVLLQGKEAALSKTLIKPLHSLGKEFQLDISMLESAEGVLNKNVEDRGTFDKIVQKQLEDCLAAKSLELAAEQEKLMPGKLEREELVKGKEADYNAAIEKATASKAALEAAKVAETEGAKTLSEKTKKVKDFIPELKKISNDLDAAKAELEAFKAGALQTFTDLKELAPPLEPEPVAEQPAAEEPAAVETVPAEEPVTNPVAAEEEPKPMETEAAVAAA